MTKPRTSTTKRTKEQLLMWLFELGEKAYKSHDDPEKRAGVLIDMIREETTSSYLTTEQIIWVMCGCYEDIRFRIRKAREIFLMKRSVHENGTKKEDYHPYKVTARVNKTDCNPKKTTDDKLSKSIKEALIESIEHENIKLAKILLEAFELTL